MEEIIEDIINKQDSEKAKQYSRFFKTGKGEYGEGDIFLGLTVPEQRKIARKYKNNTSLGETKQLLQSKYHEYRLVALLILIEKFINANEAMQKEIYKLYLSNTKFINNWDLIDLSAPKIPGAYVLKHLAEEKTLLKLSKSKDLWEKRISILSTFTFIKDDQFDLTLQISENLLHDSHDLIHKAVGWMLREIGKKDLKVEEKFLDKHCQNMPRTMLRYAIEKFDPVKKAHYMKKP